MRVRLSGDICGLRVNIMHFAAISRAENMLDIFTQCVL